MRLYRNENTPVSNQILPMITGEALPINLPVAIYYRQSTGKAIGNTSTLFQQLDLVDYLKQLGWRSEQILLIDLDMAVSGRAEISTRRGMSYLFDLIQSHSIGAVAAAHVDRFFRDVAQIDSNLFIEACRQHHVRVLTPTAHYDFAHPVLGNDYCHLFREQAQQAADFLQTQLEFRLQWGRESFVERGLWAGGPIPIGYMVDNRKLLPNGDPNPQWRKFVPFPPYAEIVKELFDLVAHFDGKLRRASRHLQENGPFFPELEQAALPADHYLSHRPQFRSPSTGGLILAGGIPRQLVTNASYIGHWIVRGVVMRWHNHEPLLEEDLFMQVFNRLSAVNLQGEPNHQYVQHMLSLSMERQQRISHHRIRDKAISDPSQRVVAMPQYRSVTYLLRSAQRVPEIARIAWKQDHDSGLGHYVYYWSDQAASATYVSLRASAIDETINSLVIAKAKDYLANADAYKSKAQRIIASSFTDIRVLQRLLRLKWAPSTIAGADPAEDEGAQRQPRATLPAVDDSTSTSTSTGTSASASASTTATGGRQFVKQVYADLQRILGERDAAGPLLQWLAQQNPEVMLQHLLSSTIGDGSVRSLFDKLASTVWLERAPDTEYSLVVHWRDGSATQETVHLAHNRNWRTWSPSDEQRLYDMVASGASQLEILEAFPTRTWVRLKTKFVKSYGIPWNDIYRGEVTYEVKTSWQQILAGTAKPSRRFVTTRPRFVGTIQIICPYCGAETDQQSNRYPNAREPHFRCKRCRRHYGANALKTKPDVSKQ